MLPLATSTDVRRPPVATMVIVALNVLAFLLETTLPPQVLEQAMYVFGIVPARYTHPQLAAHAANSIWDYIPFLTSMFLHGGLAHILGNMWTLWIFGPAVEERMGAARYALFYLACGLAAGFTHIVVEADSTVPTIGASGAISGIMGAYFVLFPHARVVIMLPIFFYPLFFTMPVVSYLGWWLLIQLFSGVARLAGSAASGGIAFWAHVGGFAAGVTLLWLFLEPRRKRWRERHPDELSLEHAWSGW